MLSSILFFTKNFALPWWWRVKKKYSNSSDPAILKLWPTQILRRTLALLPSETQRGGRDSEIQVGSSQDNIVESFTKCAHILLCKELDDQIPIPLLTKFHFGLVSKILGWIKLSQISKFSNEKSFLVVLNYLNHTKIFNPDPKCSVPYRRTGHCFSS